MPVSPPQPLRGILSLLPSLLHHPKRDPLLSGSSPGAAETRQLGAPGPSRTKGTLPPRPPSPISTGENPTCSPGVQSREPASTSPPRLSPSSPRYFAPHPALSGSAEGGDPAPRCRVLALTCPCENGAPITATEWTDLFSTKCTCVRRLERLLLRDIVSTAGCCTATGCSVRLAAFSERRRRPQLHLPTRALAEHHHPETSRPRPAGRAPNQPPAHLPAGPALCSSGPDTPSLTSPHDRAGFPSWD